MSKAHHIMFVVSKAQTHTHGSIWPVLQGDSSSGMEAESSGVPGSSFLPPWPSLKLEDIALDLAQPSGWPEKAFQGLSQRHRG